MRRRFSLTIGSVLNVGALPPVARIPAAGFRWRLAWDVVTYTKVGTGGYRSVAYERFGVYVARRFARDVTLWRGRVFNVRVTTADGDWIPVAGAPRRERWLP